MNRSETPTRRPRRSRSFVLLRELDRDSPVHRLWAGTKLVAAVAVSLTVSFHPTWPAVAVLVALLLLGAALARVPVAAVPRPPVWFWAVVGIGAALTLEAGGRPEVHVGGGRLGLGGLDSYLLFTVISVVLLGAGAIIGWTTSLGDIGPAVGRLLGPLRWLRLPVEEWATTIALCVRSLPLLVGEVRTLGAARRLRPTPPGPPSLDRIADEIGDLLVAALAVSLRRAAEMGEAVTARGGSGLVASAGPGPGVRDLAALVVVAGACSLAWLLPA